jgi:hypothetical protein
MEKEQYFSTLKNLESAVNFMKFIVIVLTIGLICTGYFTFQAVKYQKTILRPIGFNKEIIVEGDTVNEDYLIGFSDFIFERALQYTPFTVESNYKLIKALMTPRAQIAYTYDYNNIIKDAKLGKITSVFIIHGSEHNNELKTYTSWGDRLLMIDGKVINKKNITYILKYVVKAGRVAIDELGEIKPQGKD